MKKKILFILMILFLLFIVGCESSNNGGNEGGETNTLFDEQFEIISNYISENIP